jgi:hypothetical protein
MLKAWYAKMRRRCRNWDRRRLIPLVMIWSLRATAGFLLSMAGWACVTSVIHWWRCQPVVTFPVTLPQCTPAQAGPPAWPLWGWLAVAGWWSLWAVGTRRLGPSPASGASTRPDG